MLWPTFIVVLFIFWALQTRKLLLPAPSELFGSAGDLFKAGGHTYLVASPQFSQGLYGGCTVFQFDDLDAAMLVDGDESGAADVIVHIDGKHGGLNPGACSYDSASIGTGITYGEIFAQDAPFARQYRSMVSLEP